MKTLLAMFAKHWTPGAAKTRVAAAIGDVAAALVQRLFVETLAQRLKAVAAGRQIVFTPTETEREFRSVAGNAWQLVFQTSGDLGSRMQRYLEGAVTHAEAVVLIGADSPDVPLEVFDEAFIALQSCQLVLGPATDGGYYLIAVRERLPPIFEGIRWGTNEVWKQTLARIEESGIACHELPPWYDVDDEAGLSALLSRLNANRHSDEHLDRLHHELRDVLSRCVSGKSSCTTY